RIPEEFLALLRQKIDIVDIVSEHVRLKRAGRSLVGLCPFHSERTPSFHVTPSKGFYHCFGCGAGGTAITFLMDIEQLSFLQAIERLAQKAGLSMPAIEDRPIDDLYSQKRSQLLQITDLAAKFYNHILMNHDAGTQGLSYLQNRGLTKKTVAQFELGVSAGSGRTLTDFLRRRQFSADLIAEAGLGLLTERGELRDRFRGRIMFPIADIQGRTIGFGARALGGEEPKYLNTQETPLFRKGHVLYGYSRARQAIRQTGKVLLLEGYMDVIGLHQSGILNAVATLGTALTPEQAGLLRRVAEEVILVYDGDAAGRQAAQRSIEVLRALQVPVKVAQMPQGSDPDEWVREQGAEAFRANILERAMGALQFELLMLTHKHPDHMSSGRVEYLREALQSVANEESSIEREATIEWLGKTYSISLSALREDLQTQLRAKEKHASTDRSVKKWNTVSRAYTVERPPGNAGLPAGHEEAERQLLTYMLLDAAVAKQVENSLAAEFSLPIHSALQAYLFTFYADHEQADPELFLSAVDDPEVLQFATRLLHHAPETVDAGRVSKAIRDCIQCVIAYGVELELANVSAQLKQASERGDVAGMKAMEAELWRLQRELSTGVR
ncbi:MAG: DNA primase, partial [Bacilli bacterium]